MPLRQRTVSIPPWFDFASELRDIGQQARRSFNPTLVRFCRLVRQRVVRVTLPVSIPPCFDFACSGFPGQPPG